MSRGGYYLTPLDDNQTLLSQENWNLKAGMIFEMTIVVVREHDSEESPAANNECPRCHLNVCGQMWKEWCVNPNTHFALVANLLTKSGQCKVNVGAISESIWLRM